ncbi:MAG: hypothetical protein QN178_09415 [Armatimonadota bacterium]|nr:hypothetical protein [Armatimonadota bacterium]
MNRRWPAARWAWRVAALVCAIAWGLGWPAAGTGGPVAPTDGWLVASGVTPDALAENSQQKLAVHRGRILLTYTRPVAGAPQVYLATSADGGRSWQHTPVSHPPAPSRLASLAMTPDGSVHVVWTRYAPVGEVRYRTFRAGRWSDETRLSSPGVYAGVPVVARAAASLHVLWYGIRPETPTVPTRHGSVYEILATRQRAARWTTPEVISPGVPDSINPSMDAIGRRRLHAAWMQFDGRHYQVRHAAFRDDGWSAPQWLTAGSLERTGVALAAGASDVHLVWEEGPPASRIAYATLSGRASRILSGRPPAHHPVIAAAGMVAVAAWDEDRQIRLRVVQPLGPVRIIGQGARPMVATDGATAYVAWTRTAGTTTELRLAAVRVR